MAKIRKNHGIWETECDRCKKTFCLEPERWAYTITGSHSKRTYYCSYSCMQEEKRKLEKEAEKRKREQKKKREKREKEKRERQNKEKKEFCEKLGANILKYMDEKNCSIKYLAEITEMGSIAFTNCLNGKNLLSAISICKIARELDVSLDELLDMGE